MYQVIGNTRSRTFRVLWMLEEIGQPYEQITAGPRSEEVTALNPSGKVPVLVTEGQALTDSTAILTFLADRHEALTYPAGSLERARQDALTHFLLDEFDSVIWTAARHSFILPEELRVPTVKDSLKWEFERSQHLLADKLGDGPFLMGERMTIPDIIATHCGTWAVAAKFPLVDERFRAYLGQMRARLAYQRLSGG
ncbi:glutathione S-transferase family protein [Pseudoruegeria sp. SHC-113]|uniref:glutathione S-transferase family protein n=1 Tax=Pseudoruegeria sp. SHC-113 TaxID=2855439 RepID=UPI0021BBA740|nr:glutathione S-transferase family protein [Pseudoruegeria sp. SHC-113]MCT8158480.1 glutathione S-transferase family protein [Pseudoruegeria sp. SHC-113]